LIGNINVFGRKLSLDEMIAITAGADCGVDGDYLAWREMKWEVHGLAAIWRNVSKEELCSGDTAVRFINTAGATNAEAHRWDKGTGALLLTLAQLLLRDAGQHNARGRQQAC
jgi:hypothetical protein